MTEPARTPSTPGRPLTAGVGAAVAAMAVLLVVGVVALVLGLRGTSPVTDTPSRPSPAAGPATAGASVLGTPETSTATQTSAAGGDTSTHGPTALDASEPTSVQIPSIRVQSRTFVPLSVQRDGTISVPGTAQEVGLYRDGPTPGELGSSVLAAHVDTPAGIPGIFADLGQVSTGDVVRISRQDGTRLTFTVDRVAAYHKTAFPTDLVYKSDFRHAELRLVTCGGPTDSRNEYRDNVIVFAHLSRVD